MANGNSDVKRNKLPHVVFWHTTSQLFILRMTNQSSGIYQLLGTERSLIMPYV